jgi:hypothetical protein
LEDGEENYITNSKSDKQHEKDKIKNITTCRSPMMSPRQNNGETENATLDLVTEKLQKLVRASFIS